MIKAVVVDLDGVFFHKGKETFIENVIRGYDVNEDDVRTMFFSSNDMTEYKKGVIGDDTYWKKFIKKLGISGAKDELISLLTSGYKVDEKIKKLVISLRKKGLKTCICTNNFIN